MTLTRTILALAATCGLAMGADKALLGLIPKDPGMIAGVDVAKAKLSPFGQRVLAEMKDEDKGFQEFVTLTGFDPRQHLLEAVMATDGKDGANTVIVVSGTFDESKIGALMLQKGATVTSYAGVQLWKPGKAGQEDGAVAFIGSSIGVFGREAAVKASLDQRNKGTGLSKPLQDRIAVWAKNDAWVITTTSLAAMGVNANGKNQVMPMGLTAGAVQQASAGVTFEKDVTVAAEAVARSEQDAQAMSDVFKFLVGMVRLNADKPEAAELLKVVETAQLTVSGTTVKLNMTVPEEFIEKMMQRKSAVRQPRQVAKR
ncbi:MAG: hypothetical protein HY821_23195 [Acidobacteria bacterium]|nr:hypothetical protein [Acidobacteriota bacterium]